LFERIPFLAIAFLIFGLAIVGMPGTPGFDAAHLILEAAIDTFGALSTVAAALGNVAAAGFLLWAFQRAFLSQGKQAARTSTAPCRWNIWCAASRWRPCWPSAFSPNPGCI
jgi:NADH:ubiquinone oxidoreductase subunit 4 (subunit M)